MTIPNDLLDYISKTESFLGHFHVSPDADSIGSSLALKLALESQGKIYDLFCEDYIPDYAQFLPDIDQVKNHSLKDALASTHAKAYLSLDTAKWSLVTHLDPIPSINLPIINLDHHEDNEIRAKYNWVDTAASSSSELVYQLLVALKIPLDPEIATCLLFGLMGDTHAFNNYNSSAGVLRLGATLIDAGADYLHCLVATTRSFPFDFIKSWELLIHHMTISDDKSYVYSAIDHQTWKTSSGGSIALFANEVICRVTGTKFGAVMIEKQPGVTTCSLRSRDTDTDVAEIASALGGGGHKHSASFRINKPLEQTLVEFKNAVARLSVS